MRNLINLIIRTLVSDEFNLLSIPYPSGHREYLVKINSKGNTLRFQFDFRSNCAGVLKVFSNTIVKTYEFNLTNSDVADLVLISIATPEKEFEDYMVKLSKRRGD